LEIATGWGISNAQIFKEKYIAYLEFLKGWGGLNSKTLHGGGIDISATVNSNL